MPFNSLMSVQNTKAVGGSFSLSLTGTGYADVGLNPNYGNISTGTIEGWVKTTAPDSLVSGFFNKDAAYGMYLYNGRLATYDVSANVFTMGNTSINDGNWHHCALVFNAVNSKLYVDGVPDSGLFTCNSLTQSNSLTLQFTGNVCELRLWSVVKTDVDILNNYKYYLKPSATGLIGYWKCNEGNGITLKNSITTAPNMTLVSDGTWSRDAPLLSIAEVFVGVYTNTSSEGVNTTYTFNLSSTKTVYYLIVGGGGAGGNAIDRDGGGGGGGGVIFGNVVLNAGSYSVSVGYGGYFDNGGYRALAGGKSIFNSIIALGGGWGGSGGSVNVLNGNPATCTVASNPTIQSSSGNVGSSGGGHHSDGFGVGTLGQGKRGGSGSTGASSNFGAGGGGSYSSAGGNYQGSIIGGNGGSGLTITTSIVPNYTGAITTVGAGGGGGVQNAGSTGGSGVSGCSGNGSANNTNAGNGTNGTGGGGGGGGGTGGTNLYGGLGGSGVVILSY